MGRPAVVVMGAVATVLFLVSPAHAAGSGDGGAGLTAIFGAIGFVVLAAGLGLSAYRVSVARRQAREAGGSTTRATLRALSGEDDDREGPDPSGH
jgi:hypothetical protein